MKVYLAGVIGSEFDNFFTDAEPKDKEPKTITCPHCGEVIEL